MKKAFSVLLILVLLLPLSCIVLAEDAAPTMHLPSGGIVIGKSVVVYASDHLRMSDGSELPDDLLFSLKNTKIASINRNSGKITAKKAGKVELTVSSDSLEQSVSCTVTVQANVFKDQRPLETVYQQIIATGGEHDVFAVIRKLYFKNGKLTADVYFYNRFGYNATRIFDFETSIRDYATGETMASYKKAMVHKKKLKNGGSFKFTFSFPQKNLKARVNLASVNESHFPASIGILMDFSFSHDAPTEDPWGNQDDQEAAKDKIKPTLYAKAIGKPRQIPGR